MAKEKRKKKEIEIPKVPERKPHRKREKPTEPNRQIPEIVPQREKEEQNFPPPTIPEHKPQKTRVKPTKLKPWWSIPAIIWAKIINYLLCDIKMV